MAMDDIDAHLKEKDTSMDLLFIYIIMFHSEHSQ